MVSPWTLSSVESRAVKKMVGTFRPEESTRRRTWWPSMSGSITSRIIRAGLKESTLETASRPLSAVSTANPSCRSAMAISSVMLNSASTTRTRAGGVATSRILGSNPWSLLRIAWELDQALGMPGYRGGRVEAHVGRDLDRLHRHRRGRRGRLGCRLALASGAGRRRGRGARAGRGRRVRPLGQPPELEETPAPRRGQVGDAGAVGGPGRLGDPLVGDEHPPIAQRGAVEGRDDQLRLLLLAAADHRQHGPVRRKRRLRAVLVERGQRLARGERAGGQPEFGRHLAVGVLVVFDVDEAASGKRQRLDVAARVLVRGGPAPALVDGGADR